MQQSWDSIPDKNINNMRNRIIVLLKFPEFTCGGKKNPYPW